MADKESNEGKVGTKYFPRKGSGVTEEQALKYGPELERINKRHGGLYPDVIVKEAAEKNSPLHDYFTWDDSKAAEFFRRSEARRLIRSVVFNVISKGNERKPINAFFNVSEVKDTRNGLNPTGKRKYVSLDEVKDSREYRRQVIARAYQSLVRWRDQYGLYTDEFGTVFDAIDQLDLGFGASEVAG